MIPATGNERIWWFVLIALVVLYLAGTWLNRQRSKALGTWLQAGLKTLAGQPNWQWVRSISSGAEVTVTGASKPFEAVKMGFYLMTREFLPLWGIELLRGKRDLLALRADLRTQPAAEYEVVPLQGKLRRMLDSKAGDQPWRWRELPAGLGLGTRGDPSNELVTKTHAFAERYGAHIERLSVRQRQPHVILFARLGEIEKAPATELLGAVRNLVGALTTGQF